MMVVQSRQNSQKRNAGSCNVGLKVPSGFDLCRRCALTAWRRLLRTGLCATGWNKFSPKSPTSRWESGKHNDFTRCWLTWKKSVHRATQPHVQTSSHASSLQIVFDGVNSPRHQFGSVVTQTPLCRDTAKQRSRVIAAHRHYSHNTAIRWLIARINSMKQSRTRFGFIGGEASDGLNPQYELLMW